MPLERYFPLLKDILGLAMQRGLQVYLAGGLVRDLLRGEGRALNDFDFVLEADAVAFARECHKHFGGSLEEFAPFGTASLSLHSGQQGAVSLDFARTRGEVYARPGALPDVSHGITIAQDLGRRDFSINAMALSLSDLCRWLAADSGDLSELAVGVLDPYDGRQDLSAGLIRILHEKSFLDDPTRIFRALRYAHRLKAALDEETARLMKEALAAGALDTVSGQRIANEFEKCLQEDASELLLSSLVENGILAALGWSAGGRPGAGAECWRGVRSFEALAAAVFASLAAESRADFLRRYGLGRKFLKRNGLCCE